MPLTIFQPLEMSLSWSISELYFSLVSGFTSVAVCVISPATFALASTSMSMRLLRTFICSRTRLRRSWA